MNVANAPGEPIFAGELAKGLELAAAGTDIDYQGASGVELIGPGEAAGLLPGLRDQGQRGLDARIPLSGPVPAAAAGPPTRAGRPDRSRA